MSLVIFILCWRYEPTLTQSFIDIASRKSVLLCITLLSFSEIFSIATCACIGTAMGKS